MIRCAIAGVSLIAVLLGTAACNNTSLPEKPGWQTEAGACSWQWREGGGFGVWTETCRFNEATWQVIWNPSENAFVTRRDENVLGIAMQPWLLPEPSDIPSLLPALVDAGYLQVGSACEIREVALRPAPPGRTFHVLAPVEPAALQPTAEGEVPEPACGPYGASTHGVRYFIADTGWPDRLVFVDEGQERPLFEASSLVRRP